MSQLILTLTKGDTFLQVFDIVDSDINTVYFGVMLPHMHFEDSIIKRVFDSSAIVGNQLTVEIPSNETFRLEHGVYYYALKTESKSGIVKTIINKTKLIVND